MAQFNYSRIAQTVQRLLQKFGAQTTTKRRVEGQYDSATGKKPITETTFNMTAVVFDYAQELIDGTKVMDDDKQVFASVVGVNVPQSGDFFTWRGKQYTIIKVKDLAPSGISVLYELQART